MITGYILVVTHIWSPEISQPGWWSQCYMQEWRSMLFSSAWTLSDLLLLPVPPKVPKSGQSTQSDPGLEEEDQKQIFALCQEERDCKMQPPWFCSLFLHSGVSMLPFSSPAHLDKKESSHLPFSTSSAPAGWQAGRVFPGYSSAWKRDLEKAGSFILLAGGQGLPP